MSVRLAGTVVHLEGESRVEDAEPLLTLLQAAPSGGVGHGVGDGLGRSVDLTAAGPLHAAVAQVLLALRPPLRGPAGDPFAQRWLLPLLNGDAAAAEPS